MNIKQQLEKEGIKIIKPLNELKIIKIAESVAKRLTLACPNLYLDCNQIFLILSKLNMYIADLPPDTAVAKFYYKNSSIFFRNDVNVKKIEPFTIHECIHALQVHKNNKNQLIQLGLCNYNKSGYKGMALNEAAVQIITERCFKTKTERVLYYGINLPTISPSYYPLECSIVQQMMFITGKNELFESTLFCTSTFQDAFIKATDKKTYYSVCRNLDLLVELEDKLNFLSYHLQYESNSIRAKKINNKIYYYKRQVNKIYITTQNLIFEKYFTNYFYQLSSLNDIKQFKIDLHKYHKYLGLTDNYTFYNDFCNSINDKLSNLEYNFNNYNFSQTSLIPYKNEHPFFTKLKKIKDILFDSEYNNYY